MLLPYTNNRNHSIDLLRFIAASWVALFHFNAPIPFIDNWYREFCNLGHLGVAIFFIISGYCIRIAEQHAKTAKEYIIKRFFRIFPPYWFSIIVVCACILCLKIITGSNYVMTLPKNIQGIVAIFFLYTAPISHFKTINWVYWTLPYEICFYIIIFFTMLLPSKIKLFFLLILSVVAIILPFQNENILFFFNELPAFMLGYTLYLLINKGNSLLESSIIFVLSIVGYIIKHPTFDFIIVGTSVCIFIFIDSVKPLGKNIFSQLGDYSYSIYLIHVPVGCFLLGFVKNLSVVQNNISLNMLADFFLLLVVIFLSRVMFTKIELTSIKLGKNLKI
jgi:peptidoglycan/LPS O-acetylase OafA/YrhL